MQYLPPHFSKELHGRLTEHMKVSGYLSIKLSIIGEKHESHWMNIKPGEGRSRLLFLNTPWTVEQSSPSVLQNNVMSTVNPTWRGNSTTATIENSFTWMRTANNKPYHYKSPIRILKSSTGARRSSGRYHGIHWCYSGKLCFILTEVILFLCHLNSFLLTSSQACQIIWKFLANINTFATFIICLWHLSQKKTILKITPIVISSRMIHTSF